MWAVKSSWVRKKLRKHGPYGEHLSAARQALQWHMSEAALIKKYIAKAIEELKDDLIDTSSDGDGFSPLVRKRQCRRPEESRKK